jgi:hypothetical protein
VNRRGFFTALVALPALLRSRRALGPKRFEGFVPSEPTPDFVRVTVPMIYYRHTALMVSMPGRNILVKNLS